MEQGRQFIQVQRMQGMPDAQIRVQLRRNGWSEVDIEALFQSMQNTDPYYSQPPTTTPPPNRTLLVRAGIGAGIAILVVIFLSLIFLSGGDDEPNLVVDDPSAPSDSSDDSDIAARSRRDTLRRNDAGRFVAAVETYASLNGGVYPNALDVLNQITVDTFDSFDDPLTGQAYEITLSTPTSGQIQYFFTGVCNENNRAETGGTQQDFAVVIQLETQDFYCIDSR